MDEMRSRLKTLKLPFSPKTTWIWYIKWSNILVVILLVQIYPPVLLSVQIYCTFILQRDFPLILTGRHVTTIKSNNSPIMFLVASLYHDLNLVALLEDDLSFYSIFVFSIKVPWTSFCWTCYFNERNKRWNSMLQLYPPIFHSERNPA